MPPPAWMDEGINTFYEQKTTVATRDTTHRITNTRKKKGVTVIVDMNTTIISQLAASGRDQQLEQTSKNFREINYGMDVYYKTAWFLGWLEEYMGAENFEKGMHEYFDIWKFKHPYPEDFRIIMEKHSDKGLDWFFDGLLNSKQRIDFAVKKVRSENDYDKSILIQNKSGISLPVLLKVYDKDSVIASAVSLPFKKDTILTISTVEMEDWTRIRIAPSVGDMKSQNNEYRRYGLFPRSSIQLKPFFGFNNTNKQKIFSLPAIGYNSYDGFGAGLLFHNITMPENKFRFIVAPLYSFRSKRFNGLGSVAYVTHPKNTFQEVTVQLDAKSFSYDETAVNITQPLFARYFKIAPSLSFVLKEPKATSSVKRTILLKGYGINEEYFVYNQHPVDSLFRPSITNKTSYYGLLRYTHQNSRTFNPFSYNAEFHAGKDFAKLMGEAKIRIDYHIKNKSLYIRAFAGKFFSFNNAGFANSRYYLNSTFTGANDYLYDDTYFGRSEREGMASQQISMREGGLKIPTYFLASPIGRNDNWLAALNVKTDLPIKLPIRLFADVATFANASQLNPNQSKILFDAGVEVHFKDIINIYIPLVMSSDYRDYFNSIIVDKKFLKSITFSIQLDKIEWLKASSEVFKLVGY